MDKFVVGDEVQYIGKPTKFVITSIGFDGKLNGIGLDGAAFCDKVSDKWEKTGRHFPEAEALMNALSN